VYLWTTVMLPYLVVDTLAHFTFSGFDHDLVADPLVNVSKVIDNFYTATASLSMEVSSATTRNASDRLLKS
jgi:exosome complex RNA-binding protein Rrp42 (RNase PH superfamily)